MAATGGAGKGHAVRGHRRNKSVPRGIHYPFGHSMCGPKGLSAPGPDVFSSSHGDCFMTPAEIAQVQAHLRKQFNNQQI
ncbi:hypothetical protein ACX4M6_14105, partial [Roseomonas mucosa]